MIDSKKKEMRVGKRPTAQLDIGNSTALAELVKLLARQHVRAAVNQPDSAKNKIRTGKRPAA